MRSNECTRATLTDWLTVRGVASDDHNGLIKDHGSEIRVAFSCSRAYQDINKRKFWMGSSTSDHIRLTGIPLSMNLWGEIKREGLLTFVRNDHIVQNVFTQIELHLAVFTNTITSSYSKVCNTVRINHSNVHTRTSVDEKIYDLTIWSMP